VLSVSGYCAIVAVLFTAPNIGAQDTLVARPGASVRIYLAPPADIWKGTVERVGADSVFLRACSTCEIETFRRDAANRLELNAGPGGHPFMGAALGLFAGAAIGALTVARCGQGKQLSGGPGCGIAVAPITVAGGFLGLLAGSVIGNWLVPRENWRPARWP
jgi:hypothetical protein